MKGKFKFDITRFSSLFSPVMIVSITIILTSLVILSVGVNPFEAYYYMITGAFGNSSRIIDTLNKAVPICFAGFAVAFSTKAGIFNMGVEGQLVIGAFGATIAGIYIKGLPPIIHIPLALLIGALFGVLYGALPSLLFTFKGSDLLVMHILLNTIAALLLNYLVCGPFSAGSSSITATDPILKSSELPYLITKPNRLSIGIILVLITAVILWVYFYKTTSGYELRSLGQNKNAARVAGIPVKRYYLIALLLSSVLAGMAGSVEVLGNYHRLYPDFSPGYGFDGIPISSLAKGNPFGIIIGSIIFGAIRAGSLNMQAKTGIPYELISVVQGILIILISCQTFFKSISKSWEIKHRREAAR